jgi:predicted nucleic acid-binding Zn ribbon protein
MGVKMTNDEKHKEAYKKYIDNPPKCDYCNEILPYNKKRQKFCDNSCAAKKNNNLRYISEGRKKEHHCIGCGEVIPRRDDGSKKYNIYCDSKCKILYERHQYILRWLDGKETGMSGATGISERIRNWLLEQCNHHCPECGWGKVNPITGNVPLHIDHIDGHYTNNRPENLRVLCPNCHSLTENFGSLNKGNGRDYFREYKRLK